MVDFPGQLAGLTPSLRFAVGFDGRIFARGIHVATQLSREGAGVALQFTGDVCPGMPQGLHSGYRFALVGGKMRV